MARGERAEAVIALIGQDGLSELTKRVEKDLEDIAKKTKGAGKHTKTWRDELKAAAKSMAPIAVGLNQSLELFKKAISLGKTLEETFRAAGQSMAIEKQFARQFEMASDAMDSLRAASANRIDDTNIQRIASTANRAGASVEEIAQMFELAAKAAQGSGKDIIQVTEAFANSLVKGNDRGLRMVGINADLSRLFDQHAKALKKSVTELTLAEKRAIALKATSAELAKHFGEVRTDEGFLAQSDKLRADWENMVDNAQRFAATTLVLATKSPFDSIGQIVARIDMSMVNLVSELNRAPMLAQDFAVELERVERAALSTAIALEFVGDEDAMPALLPKKKKKSRRGGKRISVEQFNAERAAKAEDKALKNRIKLKKEYRKEALAIAKKEAADAKQFEADRKREWEDSRREMRRAERERLEAVKELRKEQELLAAASLAAANAMVSGMGQMGGAVGNASGILLGEFRRMRSQVEKFEEAGKSSADAWSENAPALISASGAIAAGFIQDEQAKAALLAAFEGAAAVAAFAREDYVGGAMHLVAAGLYGAVAGGAFATGGSRGGGSGGRGARQAAPNLGAGQQTKPTGTVIQVDFSGATVLGSDRQKVARELGALLGDETARRGGSGRPR